MPDRAFLVIDMLRDFVDPGGALFVGEEGREIISPLARHLEEARDRGDLVLFLCDRHLPDDAEFDMFPPHCVQGTPGAEIIPELQPAEDELVVPKRRYSGFFGTDLDIALREKDIREVALTGVCTNICVLYTAACARNRNYAVRVYADAVAGLSRGAHDWALNEMEQTLGCTIIADEAQAG